MCEFKNCKKMHLFFSEEQKFHFISLEVVLEQDYFIDSYETDAPILLVPQGLFYSPT